VTDPRQTNAAAPDSVSPVAEAEHSASEFLTLFLKDQRRIYGYLVTLLADPHDAEDLLQETAVVLLQKSGDFQPGSNFFSWACQTAYYLVLNYRRRKDRRLLIFDEDVLEKLADVPVDEERLLEVRRAALYDCLNKLSLKDRQLFESRYTSTMKGKEIADRLGRPADSIYRSLSRIRRALMECLRRTLASADREGGRS
jgi:RNA polymerase sigma-70 factor (ECF subfamily)